MRHGRVDAPGQANKTAGICRIARPCGPALDAPPDRFSPLLDAAERAAVARRCGMTPRETEVLTVLTCGLSDAAVAEELGVSLETARKHRQAVLRKCGCTSRLQLVLWLVHLFRTSESKDGSGGSTP